MSMIELKVRTDARESQYFTLLEWCFQNSASFGLAAYPDPTAGPLELALKSEMTAELTTTTWPGSQLHSGQAAVIRHYRCSSDALLVLKRTTSRLVDFNTRYGARDIHFLRQDGSPLLVYIAHEDEAFLLLTEPEHRSFEAFLATRGATHSDIVE